INMTTANAKNPEFTGTRNRQSLRSSFQIAFATVWISHFKENIVPPRKPPKKAYPYLEIFKYLDSVRERRAFGPSMYRVEIAAMVIRRYPVKTRASIRIPFDASGQYRVFQSPGERPSVGS